MRMIVVLLVALGVIYFWDVSYNNGVLSDGLGSMFRSMSHSIR
jgi:hypothetical protein